MSRPLLAPIGAAALTFRALLGTFRQQRIGSVSWFSVIIFLLAVLFAFLAAAPILSPFVYPLF
ncbi:MAG: hypothetical protein HY078_07780 [Elusimicrobia bacterium]|nr:hypothetical protein [Elusimicrobiota bacterium]